MIDGIPYLAQTANFSMQFAGGSNLPLEIAADTKYNYN